MAAKGVLIGLGSPIMSDDGVGLWVSRELHKRLPDFELDLSCGGGFQVVDSILGHPVAVIVDSMVTGMFPPGTVVRLDMDSGLETLRSRHSHGLNFVEAIRMAISCGAPVPEAIVIYGIEVEDPHTLGQELSQVLKEKLATIVDQIVEDVLHVAAERCMNSESPPK
jgi:hydrogenase maturation protease